MYAGTSYLALQFLLLLVWNTYSFPTEMKQYKNYFIYNLEVLTKFISFLAVLLQTFIE